MNSKGILFVIIQFTLIAFWAMSGSLISTSWLGKLFQAEGIFILIWAVYTMSQSKLNVLPEVRKGAILVTSGPYKHMRHPMYTGVLFIIWGAMSFAEPLRIGTAIALSLLFYFKSKYEDELLEKEFEEYSSYKAVTGRFLPKF